MKKIFSLLIGASLLFGFSSCEDDNDVVPLNPNVAFIVDLYPNDWERVSKSLISVDIPLHDLSDYYVDQGGVSVALSFDEEATYDVLPANFDGVTYSINYTTGLITIFAQDPLADEEVDIGFPDGLIVAKIILTETDFLEYQGVFNDSLSEKTFKRITLQ